MSVVSTNFSILIHSLLGSHDVYSKNSYNLIVSAPYGLITLPLLILSLFGIYGLMISKKYRHLLFVLFLLMLTSLPITLATVTPNVMSGISPYRIFYMLIPLYLLIGSGVDFIIGLSKNYYRYAVHFLMISLIIYGVLDHLDSRNKFNKFIESSSCSFKVDLEQRKYTCELSNQYSTKTVKDVAAVHGEIGRYTPESYGLEYYRDHLLPLYKYSDMLFNEFIDNSEYEDVLLINAPLSDFKKNISFDHLTKLNMPQFVIAVYLANKGLNVNYAIPYPGNNRVTLRQKVAGFFLTLGVNFKTKTAYRNSTHISYPLTYNYKDYRYEYEKNNKSFWDKVSVWFSRNTHYFIVDYLYSLLNNMSLLNLVEERSISHHYVIHKTGRKSKHYLATTVDEKDFIINYLNNNNIKFREIKLKE